MTGIESNNWNQFRLSQVMKIKKVSLQEKNVFTQVLSVDYQQAKLIPYWGYSVQPASTYYLKKVPNDVLGIISHCDEPRALQSMWQSCMWHLLTRCDFGMHLNDVLANVSCVAFAARRFRSACWLKDLTFKDILDMAQGMKAADTNAKITPWNRSHACRQSTLHATHRMPLL